MSNETDAKSVEPFGAMTEGPEFIHMTRETAEWILWHLDDEWNFMVHDSLHLTYHMSRALMELRSELGMEIE